MGVQIDNDEDVISNINITPFVDVSLVLLVIFIVTATYIVARSIPVDLPRAETGEDVVTTVAVTLDATGRLYLNGEPIAQKDLLGRLRAIKREAQRSPDPEARKVRAVIAADGAVRYREVMRLTDLVRRAKITRLAFNVQIDETPEPVP